MARGCGCAGNTCACKVIGGTGIAVTGTGTAADPYRISAASTVITGTLEVDSTQTIQMTRLGSGTGSDPYILKAVATLELTDLTDVLDDNPVAGDTLVWIGSTAAGHWEFAPGGGTGVPDGGTTGQVLTKNSNTNGDASWKTPTGGGSGGTPAVKPVIDGMATGGTAGSGTTFTVDLSSVPVGGWMVLMVIASTSPNRVQDPAGWTALKAPINMGTRGVQLYGKTKEVGDASILTLTKTSAWAGSVRAGVFYGRGAKTVDQWFAGAFLNRGASQFTSTAPSVTVTQEGSLVLALTSEATAASETGISSVTGAVEKYFIGENSTVGTIETIWMGVVTDPGTGPTPDVVVTYPNTAASPNGAGIQLILPPLVEASGGGGGGGTGGTIADIVGLQTALDARWKKWSGTQAQYDAIVTKDPGTLYVIL